MFQNNVRIDSNIICSPLPRSLKFSSPHADCLVFYLYRGIITISADQKYWLLKPGDILVLPAHTDAVICEYEGVTNTAILTHVFNVETHESAFRKTSISSAWFGNKIFMVNSLFWQGYEAYRCFDMMLAIKRDKGFAWDNIEMCYFYVALLTMLRVEISERSPKQFEMAHSQSKIPIIAAAIYNAFSSSTNIKDICGHYSMSYVTLSRHFQEEMKMTPVNFRNYVRVWEARNILLRTEHDISDIAKIIGFSDYRYFDRLFTRIIGKPPLLFRTSVGHDIIRTSH